jgi:putative tricarboxylic transport membrane protein
LTASERKPAATFKSTRGRAQYHPAVFWRRPSVLLLTLGALLASGAAELGAQAPEDHLVIVAPAAPGGGWDQTARALQLVLERNGLARVVEVQNVPGAAGTIGLSQFIAAGPAQTRSLLITGLVMLGATLWNDSPVSLSQATPIARLTGEYEVIAVPAGSPLHDMRALVEAFRRRPEAFAWGGGSAGGSDHILAGLIAEAAGIDPRRVNYIAFSGGGEAVAALLGGHVAAGVSGYSEFAAHIASGRLRPLAISAPARVSGIDAPTIRESGLAVEMVNWRGILAAAGIADADRSRLTALVNRAAHSNEWQRILTEREWTDLYLDGAAFDAYLGAERTRLARVVARLRGPAHGAPIATGQRIVPFTVLGGGVLLAGLLIAGKLRRHRRAETREPGRVNRSAFAGVGLGLVAFLIFLRPLGFVAAATALFVIVVRAFAPLPNRGAADASYRRRQVMPLVAGAAFVVLVYLAFTRGLDLPLPEGAFQAWMR